MYCGNCFRDNALVAALRKMGHSTLLVPLYLPLKLEEEDQSAGTPIFFGGINVYLDQKSALFRKAPHWLHRWLAAPTLLRWAADRAAKTRAADVGDLTISMLRGEEGHQARELNELTSWLKTQAASDVICLSNALLVGLARQLKRDLRAPIICVLQGEDSFLDALPPPHKDAAWQILAERAAEVDLFVAPSRYFGELMARRLGLPAERLRIVHNGINLDGFAPPSSPPHPPVLGYFARMCREKGLDTLVEAFILLKQRNRVKDLKLHVGGGCGPADERFVATLRARLENQGVVADAQFHPNLDREGKQAFLRSLSVFSVPALYGEAFGLYLIEAWAAGLPVVQPRHASFPELVEASRGGALCEPGSAEALASSIEQVLLDSETRRTMGEAGRTAALQHFSVERMAREMARVFEEVVPAVRPEQA
ncbi:MAG: glycosyltransferase family 4 protein [Verrucomicrobia bacterium]|nr:glycosyltransferase family 4 protein [Verrucomicrobiota bacterium]